MLYIGRRYLVVLCFIVWVLSSAVAAAQPLIMPVGDIKTGMQGIGKTVVTGTNIEEFNVEVLGVMKDKGPVGDLILVRVSGDVIDRAGGIAEGMSGSPIYIDGKLVGAVSYGWKLADHRVGMVTPIQDMLKLWEMPEGKNEIQKATEEIVPVNTPLMASGLTERALAMLTEKLKPFNMVPYATGSMGQDIVYDPLQPGSSVGVELIRGDVSLGALGTVTYVEDGKILAFGHPFLKKGNINFLLTNSYIFTTIDGLQTPFKVGTTGNLIGTVTQDRGAGIAGKLAVYPGIIPMLVTAKDLDLNVERVAAVQVVQDEQLAPVLAENTVFSIVDKTMDRTGAGTAKVSFEISGSKLPGDGIIKRENMFYHPANIGAAMTEEFFQAMALLALNRFEKIDIMDIKVAVEIQQERRVATIISARPDNSVAKPGEQVNFTVKLKPFRGEMIKRTATYTVPVNQVPGPLTLEVRGGGTIPLVKLLLKQQGLLQPSRKLIDKNETLEKSIKKFTERDRNNDIIVELYASGSKDRDSETKVSGKQSSTTAKKYLKAKTIENNNSTPIDYIVEGETQVLIQVTE